ncbi:hypothetical protein [Pseudobutyrivibrio sp.]
MIKTLIGYDEKFLSEVDDRFADGDDKINLACEKLSNNNRYMSMAEIIGLGIGIALDVPMDLLCKDVAEVCTECDDFNTFMKGLLGSIVTDLENKQMVVEYSNK